MKSVFSSLSVALASFLCTVLYYNRFIDDAASLIQKTMPTSDYYIRTTGSYFLVEFVVPLIWGVIFGAIAVWLLERNFLKGIRDRWWLPLLGGFFAILPSLYYVIFMTFFMEGS